MGWDLSCRDWWSRLQAGRSLIPDLPLWADHGERAVRVFNKLRLADVSGTPTMEDAGADWFRDVVRAMFGCVDPETRQRMIRELFLLVPKKNSKTTNGALLMLTALLLNERPRAPFLLTAPVQKTSEEAFSAIAGAISLDPVLDRKLHVRDHLKTIVHRESKAELQITTFDPQIITGKKVVGALVDEEHVLGKMQRADKAMLQLRGGMQPFPEAFLAIITTQSDEPPAGVFKDDLQKARDIRDGKRSSATLAVLYEFPQEMQRDPAQPWRDPENWATVTPNLGRSISLDRLKDSLRDEEEKGEAALRLWASQHLNIEIGLGLQSNNWAGAEFWETSEAQEPNIDRTLTLEELLRRCEVVTAGIDGGGLDDLLGIAVVGREVGTGLWLHWSHAWAHPIAFDRHKQEASKWRDFEAAGELTIVEHIGQDLDGVAEVVEKCEKSRLLDRIGVDQAGIDSILDRLSGIITDADRFVAIPQGWKLMNAIKMTERRLAAGTLKHGGSSLMAYCCGNARVEPRGNAIMITKQNASGKIDPLMATFDANALMALNPQAKTKRMMMFTVG